MGIKKRIRVHRAIFQRVIWPDDGAEDAEDRIKYRDDLRSEGGVIGNGAFLPEKKPIEERQNEKREIKDHFDQGISAIKEKEN